MLLEVRGHVAQTDDLGAEVAFRGAGAVDEFVGGEAREEDLGVVRGRVVGPALGDLEVAEATEDGFGRAGGGAVVGKGGHVGAGSVAGRAGLRRVVKRVVFGAGGRGAAVGRVVRAMPVVFPRGGGLKEDEIAMGAGNVVTKAEVLVEEHGARGNGLVAVGADFLVRVGW